MAYGLTNGQLIVLMFSSSKGLIDFERQLDRAQERYGESVVHHTVSYRTFYGDS